MRKANLYVNNKKAGVLIEHSRTDYQIIYDEQYAGPPISITLPITQREYRFTDFPAFFEGLLPEGGQLDALIRQKKIDPRDYFSQLIAVGEDLVGNVNVRGSK